MKYVRRVIAIKNLSGVTINLQNTKEVVLHVNLEIDLRMHIKKRRQLIDVLKRLYLNLSKNKNENLPIYGVKLLNLYVHEKSANDIKKGVESREPDDLKRLEDEDIVKMDLNDAICGLSDSEDENDQR